MTNESLCERCNNNPIETVCVGSGNGRCNRKICKNCGDLCIGSCGGYICHDCHKTYGKRTGHYRCKTDTNYSL